MVREKLNNNGFEIINNFYSENEVEKILSLIKTKNLPNKFGVREFLFQNSDISKIVFNEKLIKLVKEILPDCNKSIKSIYFDKGWRINKCPIWSKYFCAKQGGKIRVTPLRNKGFTNEA